MLAIGEGDEVTALRELARPMVALYVGGMGAKGKNFYNDVVRRYGFEEEAENIQDLYLSGKKKEAEALVPAELLEATSICGPESYVAERLAAFKEAGRHPPAGDSGSGGRPATGRPHRRGEGAGRLTSGPSTPGSVVLDARTTAMSVPVPAYSSETRSASLRSIDSSMSRASSWAAMVSISSAS